MAVILGCARAHQRLFARPRALVTVGEHDTLQRKIKWYYAIHYTAVMNAMRFVNALLVVLVDQLLVKKAVVSQ